MADLTLIRELCKNRKITIRELARRVGRNESAIQRIIRDGTTSTALLETIAGELGVTPGVFFGNDTNSPTANLRIEIEHLKALLHEKERLIAVLMQDRDTLQNKNVGTIAHQIVDGEKGDHSARNLHKSRPTSGFCRKYRIQHLFPKKIAATKFGCRYFFISLTHLLQGRGRVL